MARPRTHTLSSVKSRPDRESRKSAFKASLLDIASRLNEPDILSISFLYKDKINKQCTCRIQSGAEGLSCPFHHGLTGVALMDQLLEKGQFTELKTKPLVDMLHQIGRVDLSNDFQEVYINAYTPMDQQIAEDHIISKREVERDNFVNQSSSQDMTQNITSSSEHTFPCLITRSPENRNKEHNGENPPNHTQAKTEEINGTAPVHTECGFRTTENWSPIHRDSILTQSLPISSQGEYIQRYETRAVDLSTTESKLEQSFRVFDTDNRQGDEYAVVLTQNEMQEMTKMVNNSPNTDPEVKSKLSEKLRRAKLASQQHTPETEITNSLPTERDEWLSIGYPIPKLPPRAFSLDCIKHHKKLSNRSSAPEITQSCVQLPNVSPKINRQQLCTCCSTVSSSRRVRGGRLAMRWEQDSEDSGMGISQDSNESIEDIQQPTQVEQPGMTPSRQGIVVEEWKISRSKILDYIFHHKRTSLERKAHISIGSGKIKRSLNFVLHLYPEGLKDDKGMYSTLLVCITGISHVGEGLSLEFSIRVVDTQSQSIVSTRNFHLDLSQKSHTINEFLSHEVIKQSSAKHFKLMLKFQLQMPICREWVVVN